MLRYIDLWTVAIISILPIAKVKLTILIGKERKHRKQEK